MRKVLVIGCGYLGYHLANYYIQHGWHVKMVGRKSIYAEHLHPKVEFYETDIRDYDNILRIIEKDDIVIYAVGSINATNGFGDVIQDIDHNYLPFVNLLNICATIGIEKFVFLSSAGTVYGESSFPARETDCLNPINIYGLQKVYFENLIKIKQYETNKLPYLILRVSNPYGGLQNSKRNQGIIPVLINRAISRENFVFWGDVDSIRDFIYINDFLKATYLSVAEQVNEIINIASGTSTSIKQVINIVQDEVGFEIQMEYRNANNKTVRNNALDNRKLMDLTGFYPTVTVRQGIALMVKNSTSLDNK